MREILFRGKSGDKWIYGYYLFVKEQNKHYILTGKLASYSIDCSHSNLKTNGFEWFEVDPETVGQYTGLKDKNGNRIFEGDIVKYNWDNSWCKDNKFYIETCIVEYLQYGFKPFIENYDCDDGYYSYNIDFNSIEIIGNIYDNKEPLEVESENN